MLLRAQVCCAGVGASCLAALVLLSALSLPWSAPPTSVQPGLGRLGQASKRDSRGSGQEQTTASLCSSQNGTSIPRLGGEHNHSSIRSPWEGRGEREGRATPPLANKGYRGRDLPRHPGSRAVGTLSRQAFRDIDPVSSLRSLMLQ